MSVNGLLIRKFIQQILYLYLGFAHIYKFEQYDIDLPKCIFLQIDADELFANFYVIESLIVAQWIVHLIHLQ